MTFLNPLVLFGLAAAAIPLIIHLFNFRRPKKVDFSSLAFIKALEKRTMKRVRLKQWLLLALRTLAIACLVLAFARPTIQSGGASLLGAQVQRSVALVLDNSLSMTLRDARGEYMEQAKQLAGGILDVLDADDEVFLYTTAGETAGATGGGETAFATLQAAREAIESVSTAPGPAATGRTVRHSAEGLEANARNANRIIYIISDLQASTWTDTLEGGVAADVPVRILPVGAQVQPNVAVTDVTVESRIIERGEPVRLTATLVNYGQDPIDGYVASAFLSDERVAQAAADLPPGTPTELAFTFTPHERGWLPGRVEIGGDAFEPDNTHYFTLHVPRQRRLLVVGGRGTATSFLELAFSSNLSEDQAPFVTESISEGNFSASDLSNYDVVILAGPATLSGGEIDRIVRYVQEGGGLLFFPGAGAQAADYNALFEALGGGQFSGFSGSLSARQPVASFERVDTDHPLFEGVFRQTGGSVRVEEPRVFHAMNYQPQSAQGQTLIELSNGYPFLRELRFGQGAALIFAVAPTPEWSDLPVSGLFVPLLYRASYYLSAGAAGAGGEFIVGRPGELRLSGVGGAAAVHVAAPDGETYLPEQRDLYGALLLQMDASVDMPGIYEVRREEELIRRIAYNLDPRESDFARLDEDAAAEQLEEATGQEAAFITSAGEGLQALKQSLRQGAVGVELWNVFLMLALAFLIAEMFVARQWRPEAAERQVAAA